MDFVYILGTGSRWQNNEILYSLRSLVNVKDRIGKVWVTGADPGWLKGVEYVPAADRFDYKVQNGLSKILVACEQPNLSDQFVLMNDDFFFLKAQEIKNRALESLEGKAANFAATRPKNKYTVAINNTVEYLKEFGLGLIDYDVHFPMIIDKAAFVAAFDGLDWRETPYLFRSIYGNAAGVKAAIIKADCKAFDVDEFRRLKSRHLISTDNNLVKHRDVRSWLAAHFPDKSPWEASAGPRPQIKGET